MQQLMRTEVEKTKEGMHQYFKEDLEEVVEEALKRRSTTTRTTSDGSSLTTVSCISSETWSSSNGDVSVDEAAGDSDNHKKQENSIYLDKSEGTDHEIERFEFKVKVDDNIIPRVMNDFSIGTQIFATPKDKNKTSAGPSKEEVLGTEATNNELELGESDEEVVELEFERAVEKMHTHHDHGYSRYSMYCPNCSSQITKVVLRRKRRPRPDIPAAVSTSEDDHEPRDLFGCLSCFSIFISSGNRLNPFRLFRDGIGHGENIYQRPQQQQPTPDVMTIPPSRPAGSIMPYRLGLELHPKPMPGDDVSIHVGESPQETEIPQTQGISSSTPAATRPPVVTEAPSSRSVEMVKSIVYGGLMESMASLSVVSSAAASEATTLNIVVLGLANLVGGLVVLAHNLKDLRYGDSGRTMNDEKYKKELGRKEHFPLHAAMAVLSYIIFGLIPPVVYGSTFRETNDRDFKMLAVAAAALLGIFFLAIAKAYVRGERTFMAYFKTVSYYITSAITASGAAFAVGDLTQKLVEKLGWLVPPAAPAAFGASQFQLFPRQPKYSY